MSRFFRPAADSDSDSEDSDEELLTSDAEDAPSRTTTTTTKPALSRFRKQTGKDSSSSSESSDDKDDDSSDDEKSSEGDDSGEEVKQVIKSAQDKRLEAMEATGKVMDNALKINDWVAISNEFDKLARLIQRQNNVSETIPAFYIRTLSSLEAAVNAALTKEKTSSKKMNATNAKALTAMKQKMKRAVKEHEQDIKQYREDPVAYEREHTAAPLESTAPKQTRRPRKEHSDVTGDHAVDDFTTVGKGGKIMQFTAEGIFKNLQLVQEARGKKNTDRAEQIRILEKLLEVASTPYQRIRVLLALVSSRFDYNSSVANYMPLDLWVAARREVDQLVAILARTPSYSIQETTDDYDEMQERSPEEEKDGVVRVRGSIISFVDRLDDEFTKSLQNIDPHGNEYVDRLKDEPALYRTICQAQALYEMTGEVDSLCRVIMRRLEHIYSKPDAVVQALESAATSADITPKFTVLEQSTTSNLINALCVHLYKAGSSLLRTRAMLSHIYHHALHNDFHIARDMLLMSHLQESIHSADVGTQILYNRTVVQLGLCAFRCGMIKEAQLLLQDIVTTQRVKELLAQGVHQQRYQVQSAEQDKAERQRQLPFHMHINTELLEASFLVSSMLVEIPLLASIESEDQKRKVISKPFRRLLDFADRQVFSGPPESTRDHIMQASKALQAGDWEQCRDLIQSITIWALMPEAASVKEMLAQRIQEQGLRTYLFTYAPHYSTLSLTTLAKTFSLPLRTVTSLVSKMIWYEELAASLDQSGSIIVFHRVESSRTQQLAQVLAEKIGSVVEQNEKALDVRLSGSSGWGERADGNKGEKREQTLDERRGRGESVRGSARGGRGGRGARFAQGLGNRMSGTTSQS